MEEIKELSQRCDLCREDIRERLAETDRRLLALEIIVRGEDGRNGLKSQLKELCEHFYQFERRAMRLITISTSLPAIVIAVIAVLRFLGKL